MHPLQSSHLQLWADSVAVVNEANEDGLPQVVLQLLKHALDGAADDGGTNGTLRKVKRRGEKTYRRRLLSTP